MPDVGARFCPECGARRDGERSICPSCGFDMSRLQVAPPESAVTEFASWAAVTPVRPIGQVTFQSGPPAGATGPSVPPPAGWQATAPLVPTGAASPDDLPAAAGTGGGEVEVSRLDPAARRVSAFLFAVLGSSWVLAGSLLVVLGVPRAGGRFRPADGLADIVARPIDFAPQLLLLVLAVAGALLACALVVGALRPRRAALTLGVVGAVIVVTILSQFGVLARDGLGAVLPGPIVIATGGAAILGAALIAAFLRE